MFTPNFGDHLIRRIVDTWTKHISQSMKFELDNHVDLTKNYFELLGGKDCDFSIETANRIRSFGMELDRKRNFASDCNEMIIGNHLRLFSIYEHHLLPFYGEVVIGYIPDGKIFGLSKFQSSRYGCV
jgi:hypothetical protein